MKSFFFSIAMFVCAGWCRMVVAQEAAWTGDGQYRLLMAVAADEAIRAKDLRPAALAVDLQAELKKVGVTERADLSSIQIVRLEGKTNLPALDGDYAYGKTPGDRAFRWYDAAIPYEFPEFADAVSRTQGKIIRRPITRRGYALNVIGDWRKGKLAWTHTNSRHRSTVYAAYFDLLPADADPDRIPPRAWLGDGMPRCDQQGTTTMGADHCRVDLDDFNGDGLVDLIVGENYGHILWWPNLGSKKKPAFRYGKYIWADDQPLDAGIGAAPKVVDWDQDGRKDLLVGTHWNRLLFYKNVGTNQDRTFAYQGPIRIAIAEPRSDEDPTAEILEVPWSPLVRGSEGVFKRDYYPVPETVDWDRDGDVDLLLGGYVTGRIFYYENVGRDTVGVPRLRYRGPLEADGHALNVRHWCASPCVADFDADGDWDLLTGNMPMHVQSDERDQYEDTFLQMYESVADTSNGLKSVAFPKRGDFPRERLATPRAHDWDDDGDIDLVVSARENVYLFENIGTATNPKFSVHQRPLVTPWGKSAVTADQFRDWNGDGRLDVVRNYRVWLNAGVGNPFRWDKSVDVLPRGEYIAHPSGIGDDWFWPYLNDFDRDGQLDVLFGDWYGHVWFHRNLSTETRPHFDVQGYRLETKGGPIKVGPVNKDPEKDFDGLQGARTVLTASDFDRDGDTDLVVGDTYGKVRYFRNGGANQRGRPVFDPPVEIGDLKIRGLVDATDWNQDGWPDVVASAANGRVRVFLNQREGGGRPFGDGIDPQLPPIIQPRVLMVDLNGDGDKDLYLPSTQGSCFVERSFLQHGYAAAKLLRLESKP